VTDPKPTPPPAAPAPLSQCEMRFFLDDPMSIEETFHTPDHWTRYRLSSLPLVNNAIVTWWPPDQGIPPRTRGGTMDNPAYARERWRLAEPIVLHWWVRNRPGTRPESWWVWSAPEPFADGKKQIGRTYKEQLAFLRKHRLLEPVEVELLKRRH
jgi:hypothetical protein